MKENASPLSSFVTAFDDGVIMDDCDADDENSVMVSFAHLPERTSPAALFSSNKKRLNGFRETLATISNSPLLQNNDRYVLSPTKTSRVRRGKAPRIEILKQEMSSSKELQSLIQLRRIILVHVSIDNIRDATVPNEYGNGGSGGKAPFPRLLIDGQDVGGLESVLEFEADGVLGQMLKSSSFTRGFLQAGPCPPEEHIQFAVASKNAYSAMEDLRQSLDSCVERKLLQEQSKQVAQNHRMTDQENTDHTISKPVRLRHSWDAGSNFVFRRKKKKEKEKDFVREEQEEWAAKWDPCDLQAIVKGQSESPTVRDSIKHLLLSAAKKSDTKKERTTEQQIEDYPMPLRLIESPTGKAEAETRARTRGLKWRPFLLGMIAVPVVMLVASKGIAPILCTAGKLARASASSKKKNSKRRSQLCSKSPTRQMRSFDISSGNGERYSGAFRAPQLQRPTSTSTPLPGRSSSFSEMIQSNFAELQKSFYSAVSSSWSYSSSITSRMLRSVAATLHDPTRKSKTVNTNQYVCVEQGDSLWNISCDLFGDGLKWRSIAKHNQMQYPFKIEAGQCLELPPEYAQVD